VLDSALVVALVVDSEYGARLDALSVAMPVWIADTPTNRAAAEALWRRAPESISHIAPGAITTFRVRLSEPPSAWALSVLGEIDLHHGEYSQTPAYNALEVIGTEATSDLRKALEEYGLSEFKSRAGGFRASAPRVV
jgi:hypothetical protein